MRYIVAILIVVFSLGMISAASADESFLEFQLPSGTRVTIGGSTNGPSYSPRYNYQRRIYRDFRMQRPSGWQGRRLYGNGEIVRQGDYCPYRYAQSQWTGRTHCVK